MKYLRVLNTHCDALYASLYGTFSTYLSISLSRYVSPDDIHVYSIDECFIDIIYMHLYQECEGVAKMLMQAVFLKTATIITAACGIGTNLYLAKVASILSLSIQKRILGY